MSVLECLPSCDLRPVSWMGVNLMATAEGRFPDFRSMHAGWRHRNCFLVRAFHLFFLVGLALVTVVFLLEPRASDSKPIKNEIKYVVGAWDPPAVKQAVGGPPSMTPHWSPTTVQYPHAMTPQWSHRKALSGRTWECMVARKSVEWSNVKVHGRDVKCFLLDGQK